MSQHVRQTSFYPSFDVVLKSVEGGPVRCDVIVTKRDGSSSSYSGLTREETQSWLDAWQDGREWVRGLHG